MPIPFLMTEGQHVDHFGNAIWTIYVDFRDHSERKPVMRLVKGCRAEHAIETSQTVRISKPSKFREHGENLIRDPGEAYASHESLTYEAIDDPEQLANAHRRDLAVNRVYELVEANETSNTISVRTTRSTGQTFTFGKNGWLFCATVEPTTLEEWTLWHSTLQDDYDHVSYIERPREFARALATMVAQQQGPQGGPIELAHSFEDVPEILTRHAVQILYHGPVIYVDDVYALLQAATSKAEIMLLPLFAKAREYQHQREYRFVIWAQTEPTAKTLLLHASPALIATMGREVRTGEPQIMPPFEYVADETREVEDDFEDEYDAGPGQSDVSLIDKITEGSDGLDSFRRRMFDLANDPATVSRPNKLDPAASLPDDFESLTATYSAVETLRNSVNSVQTADNITPQQKLEAASAAWYAEQHIRSVCETFDDPISGISMSTDSFVLVQVSLHGQPDIVCKMAVAPTGECAMTLTAQGISSTVMVENTWPRSHMGQSVQKCLENALNPRRQNANGEPLQEPP